MVGRCPVCGATNSVCVGSGPSHTVGVTLERTSPVTDHTNFQLYEVEINGVQTTLRLSDQQAEARGITPKTQAPAKKAEPVKAAPAKKAAKTAPNKARTAKNK